MLPLITEMPEYQFLEPLLGEFSSPERRKWLSLVFDELNRLKNPENEKKSDQDMGEN